MLPRRGRQYPAVKGQLDYLGMRVGGFAQDRSPKANGMELPMKRSKMPLNLPPRGLTYRQAAAYWGVSANTFRKLVNAGVAPGPLRIPKLGRSLFDREQQDRAIDALRGLKGAS